MDLDLLEHDTLLSRKVKYALTAAICFCYFSYGLGFSIFGPTLIDLKDLTGSSMGDISYGFVGRSAVYCFSSLFCGWIFNYYNRQVGLALSLLGCGLSIISMPQMRSLFGFVIAQAAMGFAAAGVDVAGNAWLLEIWKEHSNAYMQSMHFFYAFGMTIGPILCEPFLSPDANITTVLDNSTTIRFFNVTDTATTSRIYIPYSICSTVLFMAAILQFALFYFNPYKEVPRVLGRKTSRSTPIAGGSTTSIGTLGSPSEENDEGTSLIPVALPKSYYVAVILIGGLLLCFEAGLEQNTFNYLQTFVVNVELKLTKSKGAFMTGALSASYTFSRLLSIFLATRLKTVYMLYIDFAVMLVGNVLVLIYANTSEFGLWVGLITLGFGFSSCFPAIYAFLEERINVTNTCMGMFMFFSSIATTIEPLFEGKYIENWPLIFAYINVVSIVLCVILFMSLHATDYMKVVYSRKKS